MRVSFNFCSNDCKLAEQKIGGKIAPSHYGTSQSDRLYIRKTKSDNGAVRQQRVYLCKVCGGDVGRRRVLCDRCRNDRSVSDDTPISTLFHDGKAASKYCRIRQHAVRRMSSQPQVCEATGYTRCVQTCHIVPITAFSPTTPVGVVNDKRNLTLLSPTPHWELDHGYLKPQDLGREQSFREWVKQAVKSGYLPSKYGDHLSPPQS